MSKESPVFRFGIQEALSLGGIPPTPTIEIPLLEHPLSVKSFNSDDIHNGYLTRIGNGILHATISSLEMLHALGNVSHLAYLHPLRGWQKIGSQDLSPLLEEHINESILGAARSSEVSTELSAVSLSVYPRFIDHILRRSRVDMYVSNLDAVVTSDRGDGARTFDYSNTSYGFFQKKGTFVTHRSFILRHT